MLREIPDPVPGGNGHRAGIGRLLPEEDPEQGGLPRPVASHHPHPLAGSHLERGPLEQGLPPIRFREVGDGQHGCFQDNGFIDFPAIEEMAPHSRTGHAPWGTLAVETLEGTTRRKAESPPGPTSRRGSECSWRGGRDLNPRPPA